MSELQRGTGNPRRRQNRSCDQCRAGKRWCDANLSSRRVVSPCLDASGQRDEYVASKDAALTACTNCTRWKKQCTFDWIKSYDERKPKRAAPQAKARQTSRTSFQTLAPKVLPPRGQSEFESSEGIQHLRSDSGSSTKPSNDNSFLDGNCSPLSMPSSFSHFLADEQARINIRSGLIKIFHESMEDFMSCWLIERSCPFVARPLLNTTTPFISNGPDRLLTRVCKLDQSLLDAGILSKRHNNQGFKTIFLVAMAFATQWPYLVGEDNTSHRASSAPGMFGRDLHRSLWHHAELALGEALTNPSFKVIFAGIIFASTTRPRNADEPPLEQQSASSQVPSSAVLDNVFQQYDTGQLFLDVAIRKLHEHTRKLGNIRHEMRHPTLKTLQPLCADDQQTLGVVFWLAVMSDTLSAAMNCRPFAVSDRDVDTVYRESHDRNCSTPADCCLDHGLGGYSEIPNTQENSQVWGTHFLKGKSCAGDVRVQTLRWPCSNLDAASCLADAVPIQVLLFRRVAQLQDLYLRRAPPQEIASCVVAAIAICDHWNDTYAWFVSDCVASYENLPSHLQSWYILLTSNWNLGIIILSDLIETSHEHVSITTDAIPIWAREYFTALRLLAAYAISDLAHCCCSGRGTWPAPDFQGAIHKLPLSKEPWSTVLVRSFASTGQVFFQLVQSQRDLTHISDTESLMESQRRLDQCIKALRLLGRTSDMAFHAANVLQELVQQGEDEIQCDGN